MKKSFLICFFGMDGSGKSTLSHSLFEELQNREINTSYTWWLERENSFLRKTIRKLHKNNSIDNNTSPPCSFSQKPHIFGFNFFFCLIYPRFILMNYLFFGFFRARIPMHCGVKKILIFDRYFPDVISALSEEFGISIRHSILIKLYSMIIPDPDLIFIIKVSPEISYNRKKDEILSIENAKHIWERQENMYTNFLYKFNKSKILEVDNSGDISDTKKRVVSETMQFINE